MNLKQLKAKGGIVDGALVKKEVTWVHADAKTGKDVTEKFDVHIRRQSFGVIERLFAPGVVGTISKTLAVSGASAESANAALIQLGQAFASGVLRGEELNSVMEQAPALAQAIAAGMGKTVGELRSMGAAGELTAQAVVKALQSQVGAVDALFDKTATTIGNSFTKIGNSLTHFVGELDQATGASSQIANAFVSVSKAIDGSLPGAISGVKNNSDALAQALTTGLLVALARVAGGYAQQGASALYAAQANQTALTASARTAKQDLWAAQAKQIDAKAMVARAELEIAAAQGKLASDRVRQTSELANLQAVQATLLAERNLEQQRLLAQISAKGRTLSIARLAELRLAEVATIKQVEIAERSLAATTSATSAQIQAGYAMRTAATLAYGETTAVVNAAVIASDRAAAAASVTARAFAGLRAAGANTVKDAMNDALAAGFSELTINRGLLLPVRDEPRTQFEHMYTPQNMTKGLKRQLVFPSSDDFDGVDVEYFSSITWAWETVECRWPGDLGNKVEKVKVPGIADRTRAWRIGMRRRGHQKYRNDTYRWETEYDALNSSYLSYAAVADDVPGYGQSSILESATGTPGQIVLESSEPFDWSAGGSHVIALRRLDGSLSGPWPATFVDEYHVSVQSLDFDPEIIWGIEPPHLLFGPLNRWSYPTLVTVVNPSNSGNVTVEGMPYDARVYQYDNSAPT